MDELMQWVQKTKDGRESDIVSVKLLPNGHAIIVSKTASIEYLDLEVGLIRDGIAVTWICLSGAQKSAQG